MYWEFVLLQYWGSQFLKTREVMSLLSIPLFFAMSWSLFICGWAGFSNHQKAKGFFILMMLGFAAVLGIFYLQLCWQELHSQVNLKKGHIKNGKTFKT